MGHGQKYDELVSYQLIYRLGSAFRERESIKRQDATIRANGAEPVAR